MSSIISYYVSYGVSQPQETPGPEPFPLLHRRPVLAEADGPLWQWEEPGTEAVSDTLEVSF